MIAVSSAFKNAMKQPIKQLDGYIRFSGHNITSSDDLISIKVSCESSMCKSSMRKLEAKYLGDYNSLNKWGHVGFGVKINNSFEYLDFGSFLITEMTYKADTNTTTVVGYDKMINSMKEYIPLEIAYPMELYDYTVELCNACGLELGDSELPVMNDWNITRELWENISGITYRDIIVQIAQVTCSTAIISNDDKIYFKPITATEENLTYDNLLKFKVNPLYGPINSVILARTPQEDNIYMQDAESIEEYGLTEFKIENNEIVDKDRETALPDMFDALKGIEFYPFEIETEGLGWYEIADNIDIVTNSNETFNTTIFNYSITIDGGIKETMKTAAENKTQTQYQYATTIAKRLLNTEIIVNKQDGEIKSLTSRVDVTEDSLKNTYTMAQTDEMIQTASEGVTNTFSKAGGNNIFRNTGLFFENNGNDKDINPYEFWYGLVVREKEEKASNQNCLLLQNDTLYQKQIVPSGKYTVSFRYKKLIELSNVSVIINNKETVLTSMSDTEFVQIVDASSQKIEVRFICDIDNAFEVYDLMVNAGEVKLAYSQNQNETTTDTVNISKGIEINSSETNTKFRADSDGVRISNKNSNEVKTKFTDTGMETDEATINNKATITGTLFQDINDHTWITRL